MILTYTNSKGEVFNLLSNGLRVKDGNFHSYQWVPQVISGVLGDSVKGFGKNALHYSTTLCFKGTDAERKAALNAFHAATETDIINQTPGTLTWGDDYVLCYVISSSTYPTDETPSWTLNDIDIYAPYPFWMRDVKRSFFPESASGTGLDYPYDYDFDYYQGASGSDTWATGHYAPSEFTLIIYGPAVDPVISVNSHQYGVYDTLSASEYVTIDSRNHTVIKTAGDGTETNLFDYRTKTESVFDKMPPGTLTLTWPGTYGFDLILHEERSEPEWT